MTNNEYLTSILNKYSAKPLPPFSSQISILKSILSSWSSQCSAFIIDSGSRAKGTAISIASDVDYLISLSTACDVNGGGLKGLFESCYERIKANYPTCRKQNVSVRINLDGLQVDITPARRQTYSTSGDHWVYLSKTDSRKQTNVQRHISDVSMSGRLNEIKLMKIWRELHHLDFPSIYLEYLIINIILSGRSKLNTNLDENTWYILNELSRNSSNPIWSRIVDPANSNNILSELLSDQEKNQLIKQAKTSVNTNDWVKIVW